jgi:anionic cell wall polymer biosynthesis LytR-Cps2A-Psr (LCP) family protein
MNLRERIAERRQRRERQDVEQEIGAAAMLEIIDTGNIEKSSALYRTLEASGQTELAQELEDSIEETYNGFLPPAA